MPNKIIIIAEAGVNHNGSIEIAKKLIDAAVEAQADYIKFQTFKADKLASFNAPKAEYQKKNDNNVSQLNMLKKLELTEEMHEVLIEYCLKKGINFLSTPFDESSADYLENKVDYYKVPSGEVTNLFFLEHLALKKKPIILSTGMCLLSEIEDAVNIISKIWKNNNYETEKHQVPLYLLHCTTDYPVPFADVNLKAMLTLKNEFNLPVGYSDHSLGIEVAIAAVSLGAGIIEKHFTLDRKMIGPDHEASLTPIELKQMVKSIRNIELALGNGEKVPTKSEMKNAIVARKSMHYKRAMKAREVFTRNDLIMLRPGDGISSKDFNKIKGKALAKNVEAGQIIKLKDFK